MRRGGRREKYCRRSVSSRSDGAMDVLAVIKAITVSCLSLVNEQGEQSVFRGSLVQKVGKGNLVGQFSAYPGLYYTPDTGPKSTAEKALAASRQATTRTASRFDHHALRQLRTG